MNSTTVADRESITAAMDALDAAVDAVADLSFDVLTHSELLGMLSRLERVARRSPAIAHPILNRLAAEASPAALGAPSLVVVLNNRLRIGRGEARRRIEEAEQLGPRVALTGEILDPQLPATAAAQARGDIGAEHIRIIRGFFDQLRSRVDYPTRCAAEEQLASLAARFDPAGVTRAAERLMALLDPDGAAPDEREQARRRGTTFGRQHSDGMSAISGWLTPEARATLDAALIKWAAPGMCNPEDDTPCVDGTPSQAGISADRRNPAQRTHDALLAITRAVLASGKLGQHHGLPASIIATTTLAELQTGAGHAVTAGGTLLPMRDLIRLAAHSFHYLNVLDNHSTIPLYLGRSRRTASPGQRIVLHATDRGCSHPGCTVPGYLCEVHHVTEWADGGPTDVTTLTFVCPAHHRLIKEGGWQTRKRAGQPTEWVPPPHLDDGQARTNSYHHPDRLLTNCQQE